jgi:glycosyltransferase involved in cell wall biosynthesis
MHICFLNMPIEYYSPQTGGAIATIYMNQAKLLLARGHRVTVLTRMSEAPIYNVGDVVPLEVREREELSLLQRVFSRVRRNFFQRDYDFYEYYLGSFQKALRALVKSGNAPDAVILSNDLVSAIHIRKILPRTQILVWLHNESLTRQKNLNATRAATTRFVAVSPYIEDWTREKYGLRQDEITTIWNGVALDEYFPSDNFLAPSKALRVLFLGRTNPNKGPDIVADAVEILKKENHKIELTIAGKPWFYGYDDALSDPYYRMLHEKVLGLGGTMSGHVARADVPNLVRSHDVMVVPTRSPEPFGLVALEAMACGLAVVAANHGGLAQACGEAALLVQPESTQSVADALRTLCVSRQDLQAWKQKAVLHARAMGWARNVDALEKLLQEGQGSKIEI